MTIIKILGTGCSKCKLMTRVVQEVISENSIDAAIIKVEDIMEIMKFNVIQTPSLVIDDVIVVKGRVPTKHEVLLFIQVN